MILSYATQKHTLLLFNHAYIYRGINKIMKDFHVKKNCMDQDPEK